MQVDAIEQRIVAAIPDAQIEVEGEDCNFTVHVVSASFAGQSTLVRQRTILGLFSPELGDGRLHALTVRASTIEELNQQPYLVQIEG